ncbi:MAG: hypothetical protein K2Q17_16285 [Nitrospiraceae bacterium]|jgi:hypothetical protein|nr:hypothetical protein [Nitrospiraceae bacterium]
MSSCKFKRSHESGKCQVVFFTGLVIWLLIPLSLSRASEAEWALRISADIAVTLEQGSYEMNSTSQETYDLSGEWEILEVEESRTYRAMLDRQGNGPYTWQDGQFKTTSFVDRRWRGTWKQIGNDREGEFELVVSEDGTLANGIWWYGRVGTRHNIPPREHGGSYVWKRVHSSSPAP